MTKYLYYEKTEKNKIYHIAKTIRYNKFDLKKILFEKNFSIYLNCHAV